MCTEQTGVDPECDVWGDDFWVALHLAEREAEKAIDELADKAFDDEACICNTCMVRVVLEAVWPTITSHVEQLVQDQHETLDADLLDRF